MKRFLMLLPLPIALLCACGEDAPVAKIIVTDKKMVLEEWPDSAYIASLDSILAAEPVKKQKEITTNITMNAHEAPVFKLPPLVTGNLPKETKEKKKAEPSKNRIPQASPSQTKNTAEDFANSFTEGLSKLQSDPNNGSLFKKVSASEGDDIMKLLRRTYGSGANTLPRFFVVGALKSVNPNLDLENLNSGDQVKVPRL